MTSLFSPGRRGQCRAVRALLLLMLSWSPAAAALTVAMEGNNHHSDRRLKSVLPPEPEEPDRSAFGLWQEEAANAMVALYEHDGFFNARVRGEIHSRGEEVEAVFRVQEGPRYLYGTVVVRHLANGASGESLAQASPVPGLANPAKLKAAPGGPYSREDIHRDVQFLLRRYGNAGFVRAEVEEEIALRPDSARVDVSYRVRPSYPVVFDTLIIRNRRSGRGDTPAGLTPESVFRELAPYVRGDTVRISRNDAVVEKLRRTGVFVFVRLRDSLLYDPGRSALIIEARERVPGRYRSSLFYETQFGPGVSAGMRHDNLRGSLNSVALDMTLAARKQGFRAHYASPLTFGFLLRFENELDMNWYQDKPEHAGQGLYEGDFLATNRAGLAKPVTSWSDFNFDAELDFISKVGFPNRDRDIVLNLIPTYAISFLNRPLGPTRGFRLALSYGNGGPIYPDREFTLTEYRHNWVQARSAAYHPLPGRLRVAGRLDGGLFLQKADHNIEKFFLGGARSVRSFGYRRLCPETRIEVVQGREVETCVEQGIRPAYYQASLELHVGLPPLGNSAPWRRLERLSLVPFIDYGKVWDLEGPAENLLWLPQKTPDGEPQKQWRGEGLAYGLGLRYPLFGIFNLRLDFAWGRNGRADPAFAWVLDLAQAF